MKFTKIIIIAGILTACAVCRSSAQEARPGFDLSFVAGYNLGATTPVPIPGELDITGYNPRFNPRIGAEAAWFFNRHWGVATGLRLDWKGMKVNTRVTEVHLAIDVPQLGTLTGYVTGRNTTKVSTLYLTQPLYGIYRINPHWQVRGGIYLAEALSRKFKGSVSNVEIVVESPVTGERDIEYATLDYSDDVRKLDVGVMAGAEFRMNRHVGFYADFTWALKPYFEREVPIHFTMRNVYLSVGATFRIW